MFSDPDLVAKVARFCMPVARVVSESGPGGPPQPPRLPKADAVKVEIVDGVAATCSPPPHQSASVSGDATGRTRRSGVKPSPGVKHEEVKAEEVEVGGDDSEDEACLDEVTQAYFGGGVGNSTMFPQPSCRELPSSVFTADQRFAPRPCTLPKGFHLRPTPTNIGNYLRERRKHRECALLWTPNLYKLVMGPGYTPLYVRYIRNAEPSPPGYRPVQEFLYAELPYASYCITFHRSMLDRPGVVFSPIFVPTPKEDPNWWAKDVLDETAIMNEVPPAPPGIYMPFGRLPGALSVKHKKPAGERPPPPGAVMTECGYVLTSSYGNAHPIIQGAALFPPLHEATGEEASFQDGGVGYLVYRMNVKELGIANEREEPGQPIPMYARLAFGEGALGSVEDQRKAIFKAVKFAMANAPRSPSGEPFIALDPCHAGQTEETFGYLYQPSVQEFSPLLAAGTINAVQATDQVQLCLGRWDDKRRRAGVGGSPPPQTAPTGGAVEKKEMEGQGSDPVPHAVQTAAFPSHPAPTVDDGDEVTPPEIVAHTHEVVAKWAALAPAAPALEHMAPPDPARFGDKPVVVVAFLVRVLLGPATFGHAPLRTTGAEAGSGGGGGRTTGSGWSSAPAPGMVRVTHLVKTVSDIGTRFMWDMMLYQPQLCVVSSKKETLLILDTDKAPGVLNVYSAKKGLPARTTSTSKARRIHDPHPALKPFTVETTSETLFKPETMPIPEMTPEEANANPLLQLWIRGPFIPTMVPGVEVSIYRPGTKAGGTHFAGTCHSWPVHAGFVEKCIRTPLSEEFPYGLFGPEVGEAAREAAIDLLYPPLYNSVRGQIWKLDGYWRSPEFTRRKWCNAYGVLVPVMHRAMMYLLYPGFASEYSRPGLFRTWDIKTPCEALMHFMARYGRVIRGVLQNRRRQVRPDVKTVPLNYVWPVATRTPGAPIANLILSAYNAFRDNLIVGETPLAVKKSLDIGLVPCTDMPGVFMEGHDELVELTTSAAHARPRRQPPPTAASGSSSATGTVPGGPRHGRTSGRGGNPRDTPTATQRRSRKRRRAVGGAGDEDSEGLSDPSSDDDDGFSGEEGDDDVEAEELWGEDETFGEHFPDSVASGLHRLSGAGASVCGYETFEIMRTINATHFSPCDAIRRF